eukprot:TRINITY_DN2957_c0_g1_i1.p1 TRINITY_DN2957_c0_g1~~TRINITY_DN2957_c0_g1_i1.p1  ORF type:complete len:242 (+),score=55.05 TRINITY_DN2957_c0_g1_i1:29-754(+)
MYISTLQKLSKLFDENFIYTLSRIGQMQLIRRQISSLLNFNCKIDSKQLFHSLNAMNESLLNDIKAHYLDPDNKPYPDEHENPLLSELSKLCEHSGISDPLSKIYITTTPIEFFPLLMFLFVISQVTNFTYNKHLAVLTHIQPRKKGGIDSTPFIIGFITLLKQFHSIHTQKFLAYIGQFVRSYINSESKLKNSKQKKIDIPDHAIKVLLFLEVVCKFSSAISRKSLEGYVPAYIIDNFTH